jgi:dephospho-CoA kinase
LVALGATLIDADALARQVTAAGGTAIPTIRDELGAAFIAEDGSLDRETMRRRMFSEPRLRARLEGVIHPLVRDAMAGQAAIARENGDRLIVFDLPLLVESGQWRSNLDRILVVDCETETQVQRVMRRSALLRETVLTIIASQALRISRLSSADIVLYNQGLSLEELDLATREIAARFGL